MHPRFGVCWDGVVWLFALAVGEPVEHAVGAVAVVKLWEFPRCNKVELERSRVALPAGQGPAFGGVLQVFADSFAVATPVKNERFEQFAFLIERALVALPVPAGI